MSKVQLLRQVFSPNGRVAEDLPSAEAFRVMLARERARADRNGHVFSLVTFKVHSGAATGPLARLLKQQTRTSDELGWVERGVLGVILFNTPPAGAWSFLENVRKLQESPAKTCVCMVYTYPSESGSADDEYVPPAPGTHPKENATWSAPLPLSLTLPFWKRYIDVSGALFGLALLSPLFLLVGLYIKTVSPGPVFFKQKRIGYSGRPFTFWKFRTMRANADTTAHKKLLADLIKSSQGQGQAAKPMNKLDNDPQIIPFGKVLRKSCIDELPQLINVLRGEMSMIGPRPPIPYEVKEYQPWHKGRFNSLPGMTGLWQVSGKNRLTFQEMISLDVRYSRHTSLWLDLKILLKTPAAILSQIRDTL